MTTKAAGFSPALREASRSLNMSKIRQRVISENGQLSTPLRVGEDITPSVTGNCGSPLSQSAGNQTVNYRIYSQLTDY